MMLMTASFASAYGFSFDYHWVSLRFDILDENALTCQTAAGTAATPGHSPQSTNYSKWWNNTMEIPETVTYKGKTYTVVGIGDYSFANNTQITIRLPKTVHSIGKGAFYNTPGNFEIAGLIENVGAMAFYNYGPREIAVSTGAPTIVQAGVITLSDNITSLGSAFYGANNLTQATLPSSLVEISSMAFAGDTRLKSINISEGVKSIGESAFNGCSALTSITLPEGMTSIGRYAFGSCENLTEIEIPDGVTKIEIGTFAFCDKLESVKLPKNLEVIEADDAMKSPFFRCYALSSIAIPDKVKSLPSYCFSSCSALESITLGKGIKNVSWNAFYSCNNIGSIYLYSRNAPVINGISSKDKITLYVPGNRLEEYKASLPGFKDYIAMDYIALPPSITVNYKGEGEILLNNESIVNCATYSPENFDFIILPADGNVIESATLDDADIREDIINHHLVISNLSDDATLNVTFVENVAEPVYATLRVTNGTGHALVHHYVAGHDATIEIYPQNNWSLHAVSLNGQDVTGELDENKLTIPAISGDNTLDVVYREDLTSVDKVDNDELQVCIANSTITIRGKKAGEIVRIYDERGVMLYMGTESDINLSATECVILITVRGETYKALLH